MGESRLWNFGRRCFPPARTAWPRIGLLFFALLFLGHPIAAQPPAAGPSQSEVASQSSPPAVSPAVTGANPERAVSWKRLFPNLVQDQKAIWLFPVRVAQGKHLGKTLAFILTTSALVALDPPDTPYFRRTGDSRDFNKVLSGRNTSLGTAVFPLALYVAGLVGRNSHARQTALLAGEAVIDAQLLTTVMKNIDRRLRPIDIPADGDFAGSWFKSHGVVIRGRGSFPWRNSS